jgi:hypothetical protein
MSDNGLESRDANQEEKTTNQKGKGLNPYVGSYQYAQAVDSVRCHYQQAAPARQKACRRLLQSARNRSHPTASLRDLRDALKKLGIEGVDMVKIIVSMRMQLAAVEQLEAHRRIARQLLEILDTPQE